jgi:hypothetical protein
MSDPVQPVRHHLSWHDGRRLADEDKKRGLKRILGIVMSKESAAHPPDHRAMPLDKSSEGRLVPAFDEAPKELAIGQPRSVLQKDGFAKVLSDVACQLHLPVLVRQLGQPSSYYLPRGGGLMQAFRTGATASHSERDSKRRRDWLWSNPGIRRVAAA